MFQLSFLNASLLFFAAATILPLLIWLLAKKKPQKVIFSTLRFIKMSKEQEKSRSKLKNILLLIIRMLIILLVALAVARPMFSSARLKQSAKHPPTALAILIDTSYSMDYTESGKSQLQHAKDAIRQINARTNSDDRLIIISSDKNWNLLHSQIYAGKIPEGLLEQLSVSYTPLTLNEMLELAVNKLSESQMPNQEIYLLSDNRMPPEKLKSSLPIASIPLPASRDFENVACTSAKVLPQLVERRNLQLIQFTLENHGNTDRKDLLVKAVVNDIKLAERFVSVAAGQSITESIPIELRSDGWQNGYIEINDERQTRDNRCYFTFPFYSKPRIAVITQSRSLPPILASLLGVYSGSSPTLISPEAMSVATLDAYQLFILYEAGSLSPRLREVLAALNTRKQGLLICAGNNLNADLKSYLNSSFALELKSRVQKAVSIDNLNKHHYISSMIADKTFKNKTIGDYWQAGSKGSAALVSAAGDPMMVAKDKQVLWLWNVSSLNNPFFIDPAFPVLAFRTLDYVSGTEAPDNKAKLGDVLTANQLKLPRGEIISGRRYLSDEPGVYILDPDTPHSRSIAVNQDFADSKARQNPPTGPKKLGADWPKQLFFSRLGHDLWKTLLAIAFALVILELIIVKHEESRGKA